MTIREQISEMPAEKQIAWLLRVIITATVTALGTISWGAYQKLDRIAETQSAQSAQLARLVTDDAVRRNRLETLYELHYRSADRIRAIEVRMDQQERRDDPERK